MLKQTKSLELKNEEWQQIANALHMHANYVETGHIVMSANDAIFMKKHHLVKPLTDEQKKFVMGLRELAERVDKVG